MKWFTPKIFTKIVFQFGWMLIGILSAPGVAFAGVPGGVSIACDVDQQQFKSNSKGQSGFALSYPARHLPSDVSSQRALDSASHQRLFRARSGQKNPTACAY